MSLWLWIFACTDPNLDPLGVGLTEMEIQTITRMTPSDGYDLDETNQWDGNPDAIEFGEVLFISPAWSSTGVGCLTCHDPELGFGDGLRQSQGMATTPRHSPSLYGVGGITWFRWDGGCDSLWCQAIGPIEAENEMGSSRADVALNIAANPAFKVRYENLFGPLPDLTGIVAPAKPNSSDPNTQDNWNALSETQQQDITAIMVNVTKSIAAYEATIRSDVSPIDDFLEVWNQDPVEALSTLSKEQELGLRLFVGEGGCHFCHSGPDFRNDAFHNIGLPPVEGMTTADTGRYEGIDMLLNSPFNASGPWSDNPIGWKAERLDRLIQSTEQLGQFKTPSLRNLSQSAPYMHTGQYDTLEDVIQHYSNGGHAPNQGHTDETLQPFTWNDEEISAIIAFLEMLDDDQP
jgi:cytochrome c peroxidase